MKNQPITYRSQRAAGGMAACFGLLLGLAGPSTEAQPFNVDIANREETRIFFNAVFRASEGVPIQWSGNLDACNPGTISQAYLDATLLRVNYFRAMAGVPSGVVLDAELNRKSQLGALMMTANDSINHEPPATWKCFTAEGAEAAANSNLSLGRTGPESVFGQMQDAGANNSEVGHRRWILFPPTLKMGSGSVPLAGENNSPSSVLWVFGERTPTRPATRAEFVAWPPPGFVPYQVVFHRWSFSFPGANFANATVTMQRAGANIPVLVQVRSGAGIGDPSIVWVPNNLDPAAPTQWVKPAADETYTVTVSNVTINGAPRNFTYNVTVFDPEVRGANAVVPLVTGPDTSPLNQNTTYNFNAVPGANGYQWQASKLGAANFTDGAENGTAKFDAVVGNYNPVDAEVKAAGNAGFRLTRSAGGNQQTLTYKPTLLANANSQITFKSRFENIVGLAARVEVSTDGGANWVQTFNHTGTEANEGVFTDKVVPLTAFAGREIKVRFSLVSAGGPWFTCCGALGWYFDDINFINLNEIAGAPVINNVAAGTSFVFNPTEQAEFNLTVRPRMFGQFFGEWGPSKRVSSITGGGGGTPTNPTTPTAPTIATHPQGQNVNPGANVTFTVAAQGTAPLAYVWKRNGTDLVDGAGIQGARTASLTIQNAQAAHAGGYTVQVSNAAGNVTSTPAILVVNEPLSLATALDTTGLTWATAGNANWSAQTATTHDNVDAAQSGRIADGQETRMEATINGPATVAFWWRVDSEQNFDFLRVDLDGATQFSISGSVNWEAKTLAVPAGAHVVRWVYIKDASDSRGADAGWVDQVEIRQAQPPPSLGEALDNTGLPWAAAGDRPWFAQTATTHDGADAVQSGPIGDNQSSRIEATVPGPATLTFWWKVESEQNYDFLTFELDGNRPFEPISGTVDWQQKTVPIPAGTHTIRWVYSRDASFAQGADAGWVDQIVLTRLTPGESGDLGPLLEYAASGSKLRITWPDTAEGYKLQFAEAVNTSTWIDVGENEISKADGLFFIQVNTTVAARFYRLVEIE